ncbi:MAG: hypothetical protein PHR53_01650 [Bacteroidales bacterium]|nr:hypothetical protein [Bacteroidales bacterium]
MKKKINTLYICLLMIILLLSSCASTHRYQPSKKKKGCLSCPTFSAVFPQPSDTEKSPLTTPFEISMNSKE